MEKIIKEKVNIDLSNCQYEVLQEIRKELR